MVDRALEGQGLARAVPIAVPHFATALALLRDTNLVLTTPLRLAATRDLRVIAPPMQLPQVSMAMLWHSRSETDPVQRWFREQVQTVSRAWA